MERMSFVNLLPQLGDNSVVRDTPTEVEMRQAVITDYCLKSLPRLNVKDALVTNGKTEKQIPSARDIFSKEGAVGATATKVTVCFQQILPDIRMGLSDSNTVYIEDQSSEKETFVKSSIVDEILGILSDTSVADLYQSIDWDALKNRFNQFKDEKEKRLKAMQTAFDQALKDHPNLKPGEIFQQVCMDQQEMPAEYEDDFACGTMRVSNCVDESTPGFVPSNKEFHYPRMPSFGSLEDIGSLRESTTDQISAKGYPSEGEKCAKVTLNSSPEIPSWRVWITSWVVYFLSFFRIISG